MLRHCQRIMKQQKKSKCTNCNIGAKCVDPIQRILHQCNNWQLLKIKINQLLHWCKMRYY